MKTCSVSGCANKHYGNNLCQMHYIRIKKYGDYNKKLIRDSGSGTIHALGYKIFKVKNKNVKEHSLIAMKSLGRELPKGVHIHHVNGDTTDNRNCNLVICQNGAYHRILHHRQIALDECGNANYYKCTYCKKYDDPSKMKRRRIGGFDHFECLKKYKKLYWEKVGKQKRIEKRIAGKLVVNPAQQVVNP